jgi:hypothetical protein
MTIRTDTIPASSLKRGMLVKGRDAFACVREIYPLDASTLQVLVVIPVDDDRQEIHGIRIFNTSDLVTISLGRADPLCCDCLFMQAAPGSTVCPACADARDRDRHLA